MITAIKAYYDGSNFVALQNYTFRPQQQVLIVVDEEVKEEESAAQKFLKLSWQGDESAEELLDIMQKGRVNSERFETKNAIFD